MRAMQFCFVVCLVFFLISCASTPEKAVTAVPENEKVLSPQESIVGKWVLGEESIEFLKDGQMKFSEEISGNYEIVSANQIRFAPPGESPSIYQFQVSEVKLSLMAPDGDSIEFVKPEYLAKLKASGELEEINKLKVPQFRAWESEALSNLVGIRTGQEAHRVEYDVYLECKPSPPGGGNDSTVDPWVDAGGFRGIGFEPNGSVRYQYAVTVSEDGKSFTATAVSDLDDNGIKATYTISNTSPDYPNPTKTPEDEY